MNMIHESPADNKLFQNQRTLNLLKASESQSATVTESLQLGQPTNQMLLINTPHPNA